MATSNHLTDLLLPKGTALQPALGFVTSLGVTGLWLDETGSVPHVVTQAGGVNVFRVVPMGVEVTGEVYASGKFVSGGQPGSGGYPGLTLFPGSLPTGDSADYWLLEVPSESLINQFRLYHRDASAAAWDISFIFQADTLYLGANKFWHAGNDGTTSGLDADLLDGQHGSYYASVASLSGYIDTTATAQSKAGILGVGGQGHFTGTGSGTTLNPSRLFTAANTTSGSTGTGDAQSAWSLVQGLTFGMGYLEGTGPLAGAFSNNLLANWDLRGGAVNLVADSTTPTSMDTTYTPQAVSWKMGRRASGQFLNNTGVTHTPSLEFVDPLTTASLVSSLIYGITTFHSVFPFLVMRSAATVPSNILVEIKAGATEGASAYETVFNGAPTFVKGLWRGPVWRFASGSHAVFGVKFTFTLPTNAAAYEFLEVGLGNNYPILGSQVYASPWRDQTWTGIQTFNDQVVADSAIILDRATPHHGITIEAGLGAVGWARALTIGNLNTTYAAGWFGAYGSGNNMNYAYVGVHSASATLANASSHTAAQFRFYPTSLSPGGDAVYDLGTSSLRWNVVYAGSLSVTSGVLVANLNADRLDGYDWANSASGSAVMGNSGSAFGLGGMYWDGAAWVYSITSGRYGFTLRHSDAAGVTAGAGGALQILFGQSASTGAGSAAGSVVSFLFDKNGSITAGSTSLCTNLNADLLDGQQGSYYLDTSNSSQTKTGILTVGTGGTVRLTTGSTTPSPERPGFIAFYTADNTRRGYIGWSDSGTKMLISSENGWTWSFSATPTVGSSTMWHAGNDGASSGLDADLLDGQHGSFYQSSANHLLPISLATGISSSTSALLPHSHFLNLVGDDLAFRTATNVEYWDFVGEVWTAATTGQVNPQILLTGRVGMGGGLTVLPTYRKWRFTALCSTYLGQIIFAVHQTWNNGAHQLAVTLERGPTAAGAWTTMIAETTSPAGEDNYHFHVASTVGALGEGYYRFTVESKDAVNSASYTALQLLFSYTRTTLYGGIPLPMTWDYARNTTFPGNLTCTSRIISQAAQPTFILRQTGDANNHRWFDVNANVLRILKTNDAYGSFTQQLSIDSVGNLSIGTIAPTHGIHVRAPTASLALFEATRADGPVYLWMTNLTVPTHIWGMGADQLGGFGLHKSGAGSWLSVDTSLNAIFTNFLTAPRYVSTVATGTVPYTTASTTVCPNLNADLFDGAHRDTLVASIRANCMLTGGATITYNSSFELAWSGRMIVLANGRGTFFSTVGFFDITLPTAGTVITGVGGAVNQTVTAGGIPMTNGTTGWVALYYILPIGSGSASLAANFRLVSYTGDLEVPEHWVMIAMRNGDTSTLRLGVGISLRPNSSYNTATTGFAQAPDSDLLDGYHAAAFLLLTGGTLSGILTISNTDPRLSFNETDAAANNRRMDFIHQSGVFVGRLYEDAGTVSNNWLSVSRSGATATAIDFTATAVRANGNTLWHAGNDGHGSGLDADLLDGQHGSYYAPLSTVSWIPAAPGSDGPYVLVRESGTYYWRPLVGDGVVIS